MFSNGGIVLRNFVVTNPWVKLGSLLVAVGLWAFALSGATRTGLFPGSIPLQLNNVPDQIAATANIDTVRVRIAADQAIWRQLSLSSFVATADLSGRVAGVTEVPVQLQLLIPNVQVVEIQPKTVVIQLEPLVSKAKSIQVRTQGEPAAGFFASEATADPTTVSVRGPGSQIDRLDHVTAVIDVAGANLDRDESVKVQAIDGSGRPIQGLSFSPTKVHVHQPLTKLAATKTVGVRVVTTGVPLVGRIVSPITTVPTTVTVAGSEQRLAGVIALSTVAIDITKITQRTIVHSTLDVPKGLSVTDGTDVDVTFDVSEQDTVRAISARLQFIGLPPERRIVGADPATATVVVRGPAAKLTPLGADDAPMTVDLTGALVGERRIDLTPAQLKLPDGITLQQLVTTAITVRIE